MSVIVDGKKYLDNRTVGFSSPGPEFRKENGLETLFALCRVFGWRYEITKESNGKYTIEVEALGVPTDFYWPCERRASICIVGAIDPYDGMISAMSHVKCAIVSNAEKYRSSFLWQWESETKTTWGRHPEKIEEKSWCIGESK